MRGTQNPSGLAWIPPKCSAYKRLRKNTLLHVAQKHKYSYAEAVFYFGKVNAPLIRWRSSMAMLGYFPTFVILTDQPSAL